MDKMISAALCATFLMGASAASAQTPAPRPVPEGFVLPGPAPTNAPPAAAPRPASPVLAAPEQHGSSEWPCVQRRVARMDAGQIWPNFPEETRHDGQTPETRNLVREVAQRRIPLAESQERLTAYLAQMPAERRTAAAAAIFSDLLDTLNRERADVISGLTRYADKQKNLAQRIRKQTSDFDQLLSQPTPDPQKVAAGQEELLWETRVFDDRRQSLTYVCEVPVLIEQRMFALGRTLRAESIQSTIRQNR